jgi:predicted alpha/beta-hydrolase family hydrolase
VRASELRFAVGEDAGEVSALLLRPAHAYCLLVLAHGAGAGMRQAFMEALAARLWERRAATFRYQFPYMETGRGGPNSRALLAATVRAAVGKAAEVAGDLPLLAGGKSMGGRMTSLAAAAAPLPGVRGLVFFGFPLHAAGRPSVERGKHLCDVPLSMLFLQGTRDRLADLQLMQPLCNALGHRAALHVVEGADHSFRVLKRSERSDAEVLDELADSFGHWSTPLV